MNRILLMLIGAAVLVIATGHFYPVAAQPPVFVLGVLNESGHHGIRLMQYGSGGYGYGEGFDREGCEADCRAQFGVDLYARSFRGGSRPGYYAYAQCIQNCETRFWKDFDRRSRQLEKE
jgi:hypothetical protein